MRDYFQLRLSSASGTEHDVVFENGQLLTVSGTERRLQKIKTVLLLVRGEWFRDTTIGVPYFEKVFVKSPDIANVKALYRDTILRDEVLKGDGVSSVEFRSVNLDKQKRKLTMSIRVKFGDGETVEARI